MNKSTRILSFDDVIELCGSVFTSRGGVYKASGKVRDVQWNAEKQLLTAAVKGTAADPYRQRVQIEAHSLSGTCTCPVQYNCKHVAAALLTWIDQQNEQPTESDQSLRSINRWLQDMVVQGKQLDPSFEQHTPGEPLLFFQLDETSLSQHQLGVELQILQSRLLKRGGYGKEAPYRYHAHFHHPDWVQPSDHAILELAIGKNADISYRTLVVEGDTGHLLMTRLVATERCFWGSDRDKPITLGESRRLDFDWQRQENDEFQLDVTLEGSQYWHMVPTEPAWYLDTENQVAGLLKDVPPTGLLSRLMKAPAIPEAHAQAISNFLASRLPAADLPLPAKPNFERVVVDAQPILILQSKEESPDIRDYFAAVHFRYADYTLPFNGSSTEDTLEGKTRDGKPLVLKRNLAQENRFAMQFEQRFPQFTHANESDPDFYSVADLKPGTKNVYELATQWRQLLEQQEALEADGWEILKREPFDLSFEPITQIEATVSDNSMRSSWFDMALKLNHEGQQFDLVPLVIEWLETGERDQPILLQAETGQWLEVSPEIFAPIADTLQELFNQRSDDGNIQLMREHATALDEFHNHWESHGLEVRWDGAEELLILAEKLRNFEGLQAIDAPQNLHAELRPYQLEGLAWLDFLADFGMNGVLADDMGLGKTLQTLAHILHEKQIDRIKGPTLIVAPTSLLVNWSREAARFTPDLTVMVWHGADRKQHNPEFSAHDIVITSYALVNRDASLLKAENFQMIVLDEAQAIKNPSAKITQTLKEFNAPRRLCLTGTPLENHLGELWSLFDFLMPGLLGNRKLFSKHYRTPIESQQDIKAQVRLTQRIKPFLLRRRKEEVASDLPPKTEIIKSITLEGDQARLYESIRVTMEQRVQEILRERGLQHSHIELLDALLKLRQTCCHPALVKLASAEGIMESAKTKLMLSMLEELIAEGKKILLFSQFTSMLEIIEKEVTDAGIPYVKLTGRTRNRADVVDSFQNGEVPLFLISLKAGGTGLNLTAADTVIHYDPWWNPAVENQASDRAHRIGQTKPVFIYKLVASNTVEEKILTMQEYKKILTDGIINADKNPMGKLSADDFLELFAHAGDVRSVA